MAYPNPAYDPNWKAVHDYHDAARRQAQEEQLRLGEAGDYASGAYAEADRRCKHHLAASLATFETRCETVQAYADWLFSQFRVDMHDHGAGVPIPQVDFETFRTIQEVNAAWSRIERMVAGAGMEKLCRLPTGQPEGLTAFADPTAPDFTRSMRIFSAWELYPGSTAEDPRTHTIMTTDRQVDGWHVCFTHCWGRGRSVTNAIEHLATAVYREACAIAEQTAPKPVGLRGWFTRFRDRGKPALDPSQFHFYDHMPPPPDGGVGEDFCRVLLQFERGMFRMPEWQRYRVVPDAIQSARFELARDAAQGGNTMQPALSDQRNGIDG
jgi:hypothetical protein